MQDFYNLLVFLFGIGKEPITLGFSFLFAFSIFRFLLRVLRYYRG